MMAVGTGTQLVLGSTIWETLMRRTLGLVAVVGFAMVTGSAEAAAPGTTTWQSRDGLNGAASNAASGDRSMASGDGSRVVFESKATNLGGTAGTNTLIKGYLRDVRTGVN